MVRTTNRTLVLASTSPYRAGILDRLQITYTQVAPIYKEEPISGESPTDMALRLSEGKARSLDIDAGHYIIIGSDQVAHLDDQVYGKPGTPENALGQLRLFSGRWVSFTTGICLLSERGDCRTTAETYEIRFRALSDAQITEYLRIERPYDCAGSIKVESLGITLLSDARGRDVNCLYGLPIMLLREQLELIGSSINDFMYIP